MIVEAAVVAEVADFAREIMAAVEAWNQGSATEEQLQTIHAANQAKRAHVIGLLDALDDRDAARKAAESG